MTFTATATYGFSLSCTPALLTFGFQHLYTEPINPSPSGFANAYPSKGSFGSFATGSARYASDCGVVAEPWDDAVAFFALSALFDAKRLLNEEIIELFFFFTSDVVANSDTASSHRFPFDGTLSHVRDGVSGSANRDFALPYPTPGVDAATEDGDSHSLSLPLPPSSYARSATFKRLGLCSSIQKKCIGQLKGDAIKC